MKRPMKHAVTLLAATALAGAIAAVGFSASAAPTDASLQSAGALAFAPNGVLLIGDSAGGQIVAVETGDTAKASAGNREQPPKEAKSTDSANKEQR